MPRITVTFGNSFQGQPIAPVSIESGTTVRSLLATQGGLPDKAQVNLNREKLTNLDTPLNDGDYIAVVPSQVKGA